ncbi:MAG: hypothetical protein H6Q36_430 [Chloroflexi bacterium]|nr:hypothetical protein [Chloroflexota bacterium]
MDGPPRSPGDPRPEPGEHAHRRPSPAERRARRAAIDDPEEVLTAALRRLEVRAFSVAGLRRRLLDAGYRADLVDGAVQRLVAVGVLDDAAYARDWLEARDRARPRGAAALRRELAQRGVEADVIASALAAREEAAVRRAADQEEDPRNVGGGGPASSLISDEDAASRLLARRGRSVLREPDPRKRRAKAYALLARNGFDPDVCASAAAAWLAAHEDALGG